MVLWTSNKSNTSCSGYIIVQVPKAKKIKLFPKKPIPIQDILLFFTHNTNTNPEAAVLLLISSNEVFTTNISETPARAYYCCHCPWYFINNNPDHYLAGVPECFLRE